MELRASGQDFSLGDCSNLDDYMTRYGSLLGLNVQQKTLPLHQPLRDPLHTPTFLRTPFESQAHVIEAGVKALRRQKTLFVVGEMSTGKTLMGQCTVHQHAAGKPYRALVMCPGQLVKKWQRELKQTIPGCTAVILDSWRDVIALSHTKPTGATWHVIGRDTAKLGSSIRAAVWQRGERLHCPKCGQELVHRSKSDTKRGSRAEGAASTPISLDELQRRWQRCQAPTGDGDEVCGEPLWQLTNKPRRFAPGRYIHKKLNRFFDYFVADEVHEEKGADTAQANALGSLAAASKKVIALTGTLIGGQAEHIRPLLFRLAPQSLVAEGYDWQDATAFNETYGRIEKSYDRIPWKDGLRGYDFYKYLERMIPGQHRSDVSEFRFASPGFIKFELLREVADSVSDAMRIYGENYQENSAKYKSLDDYIRNSKLNEVNSRPLQDQVWTDFDPSLKLRTSELMNATDIDDGGKLLKAAKPFDAAKIMLYFVRRLRDLHGFEIDGSVRFPVARHSILKKGSA